MKTFSVAVASVAALLSAPALAADLGRMPPRAQPAPPPPMAAPAYMPWNGFYIGAQVGYQGGRDRVRELDAVTGALTGFEQGFSSDGIVGGAHVGYNYQTGMFVFGIEGDLEGSGARGSAALPGGVEMNFENRWQGSLRGRAGVAFGSALLYATGGLALADINASYITPALTESFQGMKTGWTVGGGAEWKFAPAWSTRLEYRYTKFESLTDTPVSAAPGFAYETNPESHAVRMGVSYHFN